MTIKLKHIYKEFPTEKSCIDLLEKARWGNKPICPHCGLSYYTSLRKQKKYHCNTCNSSFSVTSTTFLHKTKIDIQKWFFVIRLLSSNDDKISVRDLAKEINVTKDTALRLYNKVKQSFISESPFINRILNQLYNGK